MSPRHSIAAPVTLEGIGLHLGQPCRLTFRPADGGAGISFRRVDLPDAPPIPARVEHAVLTERRTQLGAGEHAFHTVEHVLAVVMAHEIDDLLIEMDGPEPPILDGSAQPFFEALARHLLDDIAELPHAFENRIQLLHGDLIGRRIARFDIGALQ